MTRDRMFHVIVLGGMGLVACGGITTANGGTEDGSTEATSDAFPSEGRAPADAGVPDAFPHETKMFVDAEGDSFPADTGQPGPLDGFPSETDTVGDAEHGMDAKASRDAFPHEL
jgi:hypothetical protein